MGNTCCNTEDTKQNNICCGPNTFSTANPEDQPNNKDNTNQFPKLVKTQSLMDREEIEAEEERLKKMQLQTKQNIEDRMEEYRQNPELLIEHEAKMNIIQNHARKYLEDMTPIRHGPPLEEGHFPERIPINIREFLSEYQMSYGDYFESNNSKSEGFLLPPVEFNDGSIYIGHWNNNKRNYRGIYI